MRHATLALLAALAIGAVATPVLAQDGAGVSADAEGDAELAFLRAYYQEKGLADHAAAEKLYDAVVREHASRPSVVAKSLLGRLRCLRALGRNGDADAVLQRLESEFSDRPQLLDEARRTRPGAPRDVVADVSNRVVAALRNDNLSAAAKFGAPAVPTLARTLRVADPALAERAARVLVRIGSDEACDALAAALHDSDVVYRDEVIDGVARARLGLLPERLGRAIVASPDAALREKLLLHAMSTGEQQPWFMVALRDHEWARAVAFPETPHHHPGYQRVVVQSLATGPGALHDAALDYVRRHDALPDHLLRDWGAFRTAPPALLADEEALKVVCRHLLARLPDYKPSLDLRAAVLRVPEHREMAMQWCWMSAPPDRPDPDHFLAGLTREDWFFSRTYAKSTTHGVPPHAALVNIARRLDRILGPEPTAEQLRRLGSVWAEVAPSPAEYLAALEGSGGLTTGRIQALHDGLHSSNLRGQVVMYVAHNTGAIDDDAWSEKLLAGAAQSEVDRVRSRAVQGLVTLARGGSVDLTAHADVVAEWAADWNQTISKSPLEGLLQLGPVGHRALVKRIEPGRRGIDHLIHELAKAGAADAAPAVRRVLLAPVDDTLATAEPEPDTSGEGATRARLLRNKWTAARALCLLEGPAARDALRAAMLQGGKDHATQILQSAGEVSDKLGSEAYAALLVEAFGRAVELDLNARRVTTGVNRLTPADHRMVAAAALRSPSVYVRRWGAQREVDLLDRDTTDLLVGLASDPDGLTRKAARDALTAMREADTELAWLQSVGRRRETVARVEELLGSTEPRLRQAGIAGLVATGSADAVTRLLRIATDDPDAGVAAEARRALIALGRPAAGPKERPDPK